MTSEDKSIVNEGFPTWFVRQIGRKMITDSSSISENKFREIIADSVLIKSNWVSQIEVDIFTRLLKKNNHVLYIFNHKGSMKNIDHSPASIYILNMGESHYNAISRINSPTVGFEPTRVKTQYLSKVSP